MSTMQMCLDLEHPNTTVYLTEYVHTGREAKARILR